MKVFWDFFVLLIVLLVSSSCCAHKSRVAPDFVSSRAVSPAVFEQDCAQVYPQGRWQFVHSIDFTMAGGGGSSVLGVSVLDGGTISCALVTIEGLTLFEARLTDKLEVLRELPPFDKPGFAAGLLTDVQTMFMRPSVEGGDILYGYFDKTTPGCQLKSTGDRITDILLLPDGCWRIYTETEKPYHNRTLVARSCKLQDGYRLPGELKLTVSGPIGYTLKMTLLRAEKIQAGQN